MTTEAEALANILAWSTDSPGWQRDALRRLATQAALEPAEIDELASRRVAKVRQIHRRNVARYVGDRG